MGMVSRRSFMKLGGLLGVGSLIPRSSTFPQSNIRSAGVQRPIAIASGNGTQALERAMAMMKQGADSLDAAVAGVAIVEDDPNEDSVGYGGLPNEEGVVELDAAVMHGPTYRAGAVASLRNIKNPSRVAQLVMERTDHVLIVGEGALRFAKAHGFKEENLLTESSRKKWLKWKENLSKEDDWLPPHSIDDEDIGSYYEKVYRNTGTIHLSAMDAEGNLSCVTTTSGLSWKIPGRVGDSPIIGAGLYCDNEVGSAGSTGRGEANLLNCSSVMIVEWMRQGKSPEEACLLACKRIVDRNRERRLLDKQGKYKHNVKFYAVNKQGEHGGASIWGEVGGTMSTYLVHDGKQARKQECAYLFAR
jgi:N4-(beta-N-acetylglucosaminyl)-L-asparaginase